MVFSLRRLLGAVALVVAASPPRAFADEPIAAPAASEAAPRTWRAALSLEYGMLDNPSECPGYCQTAYGPALAISGGYMLTPRMAVVGEGWIFQRDALAGLAGAQLWLGDDEEGWVRGSAGIMSTKHHNADGGGGDGTGPALSLGGGARLSCFDDFSTELSARLTAVFHELGYVTSFTVGYGLAW
jgi:hypothetical protein